MQTDKLISRIARLVAELSTASGSACLQENDFYQPGVVGIQNSADSGEQLETEGQSMVWRRYRCSQPEPVDIVVPTHHEAHLRRFEVASVSSKILRGFMA